MLTSAVLPGWKLTKDTVNMRLPGCINIKPASLTSSLRHFRHSIGDTHKWLLVSSCQVQGKGQPPQNANIKDEKTVTAGFFKDFIYLILERGDGREKERERNIDVREKYLSGASRTSPNQGLNLQLKHMLQPRIEPATLCSAGWHPAK